jgi:hypothetical protein
MDAETRRIMFSSARDADDKRKDGRSKDDYCTPIEVLSPVRLLVGCANCGGTGKAELRVVMPNRGVDQGFPMGPCLVCRGSGEGQIGLDPCSNADSIVDAKKNWTIEQPALEALFPKTQAKYKNFEWNVDGLSRPWRGFGLVYINFPYSASDLWAPKIVLEATLGVEIVVLPAARVDTEAWDYLWRGERQCFWGSGGKPRRRIKFIGAASGAPFPSALVYFGKRVERFTQIFQRYGQVVMEAK